MPVYNTESTVIRSIKSVMDQTDPDFELIIINDDSPDKSDSVIRNYLDVLDDPRIRYLVNKDNIGLPATRSHGIREASGNWVAFLDSDDAYHPDFLNRMHQESKSDVDIVVCCHDILLPDGTNRYRVRGEPGSYTGNEMMIKLMEDRATPYVWDKIFRLNIIKDAEFPDVNRLEDFGFTAGAFQKSRNIVFLDDSLYLYTVNSKLITWSSVPPIEESYKFLDEIKKNTAAHTGSPAEQNAFAVTWVLTFLNSAQAALRTNPENLAAHLKSCKKALRNEILKKCFKVRPEYGMAGVLLRTSPRAYAMLYNKYVERLYEI